MRITARLATVVTLVLTAVVASAQTPQPQPPKPAQTTPAKPAAPPTTQPTPAKPAPPPAAQPASPTTPTAPTAAKPAPAAVPAKAAPAPVKRPTPSQVIVRDRSGSGLRDVKVSIAGTSGQDFTTDATGTASLGPNRDGSFRLRFEREGFITLERDVTLRAAQPSTIEVALNFSPPSAPPPAPPPPEPVAPPEPVVVTVLAPRLSAVPSGPPVFVSIPNFLDKNYIGGREPLKESVLACLADSTTRVLQLHESIGEHTHAEMDEVLYVVAGEGTIRARGESSAVTAGALTVIPHGVAHAIERRGKNPLMVLSLLSGAPCPLNAPPARGKN